MVWILQQIILGSFAWGQKPLNDNPPVSEQMRNCSNILVGPDNDELSLLHKKIVHLWCKENYRDAKKMILKHKKEWKDPQSVLQNPSVLLFLEGLIWGELEKEEKQLNAWRQALLWNPDLQWPQDWFVDSGVLREKQTENDIKYESWWDLFLAVRTEFSSQSEIDPHWPKQHSNVDIFVNGVSLQAEKQIFSGTHWVQIQCPKEPLVSMKLQFPLEEPIDWINQCTKGVVFFEHSVDEWDLVEIPNNTQEEDASELSFSVQSTEGFILNEDILRSETSLIEPYVQKYPMSDQVKVVTVNSRIDWLPLQVGMLIGGAALMAAGGSWTLGVVRPLYADVLSVDPAHITRTEADELTAKFSKAQLQAKVMLYSGAVICTGGASFFLISAYPNRLVLRFEF